jgi:hypothetical protein
MMNEANLTVKCVRMDGMYDIWPAKSVTFWPTGAFGFANVEGESRVQVVFEQPDGTRGAYDRGTVYVMNASGKTIDTINLDLPA